VVEIATDEKLLKLPVRLSVFHDYGEPFEGEVSVYSLEEIVAEKLRAILQHLRALERRGWVRSRARDYYDLWRVLSAHWDCLDLLEFPAFLRAKCAIRGVTLSGPDSFFPEGMLAGVEAVARSAGPQAPTLQHGDRGTPSAGHRPTRPQRRIASAGRESV